MKNKKQNRIALAIITGILSCAIKSQTPMIRLSMSGGNNNLDETVIYYQQGATTCFDNQYDAYKLTGPNPAPMIAQQCNNILLQINGVDPVIQTTSFDIKTTTPVTANFTITASDFSYLPQGTCVKLDDLFTGQSINILDSSYTFSLHDTTSVSRFKLTITYNTLQVLKQVSAISCDNDPGKIIAFGNSTGPWDFHWYDYSGNNIRSRFGKTEPDTLDQLLTGTYFLNVLTVGGCDFGTDTVTLFQPTYPTASFSLADTIYSQTCIQQIIQNNSINSVSYFWNFGTGDTSALQIPQYCYTDTGNFVITLVASSSFGCTDTIQQALVVIPSPTTTSADAALIEEIKLYSVPGKKCVLKIPPQHLNKNITTVLFDHNGMQIKSHRFFCSENKTVMDLSAYPAGYYIMTLEINNEVPRAHALILSEQ